MTAQRFLTATVAAGVTLFIVGFLIWGLAFASFFEANVGSATGVIKDPPGFVAIGLGQLAMGALLALVLGTWARVSSVVAGIKAGAMLGFVMALSYDLTLFGSTNTSNLAATLVDPFLALIQIAIGGGVVGAVLARR